MNFPPHSQFEIGDSWLSAAQKKDFDCRKLTEEEKESLSKAVLFEDVKDPDILLDAKATVPTKKSIGDLQEEIKTEEQSDVDGSYASPLNAADLLDSDDYKPFGQLLFACPFTNCSSSYQMFEELEEHMKIHPDTQYFICDVCETNFFSKGEALAHVRQRERKECCACENRLPSCAQLVEHFRSHNTGDKPFICTTCGHRFAQLGGLNEHSLTHKKRYFCETCGQEFVYMSFLRSHMSQHTGDANCVCAVCDKRFTTKRNLKIHEQTHAEEKPYKCNQCDFKCNHQSNQSNLIVHNRIHTGEKPYACGQCEKRFSTTGNLRSHEMTHTGEKAFECSYCGNRFSHKSYLTSHIRLHTGEKPYSCQNCDEKFIRIDLLKTHVRRKHPS